MRWARKEVLYSLNFDTVQLLTSVFQIIFSSFNLIYKLLILPIRLVFVAFFCNILQRPLNFHEYKSLFEIIWWKMRKKSSMNTAFTHVIYFICLEHIISTFWTYGTQIIDTFQFWDRRIQISPEEYNTEFEVFKKVFLHFLISCSMFIVQHSVAVMLVSYMGFVAPKK